MLVVAAYLASPGHSLTMTWRFEHGLKDMLHLLWHAAVSQRTTWDQRWRHGSGSDQ